MLAFYHRFSPVCTRLRVFGPRQRGFYVVKAIFWLAATVALLSGMVSGTLGSKFWLAAVVAGLIMVRRSWPKKAEVK